MGKTEAGLLWIGNNKGFFTLPLKSAINSIYDRIRSDIVNTNISERLGLLHSDAISEIMFRQNMETDEKLDLDYSSIFEYNAKSRLLSLPLTITTIDQLFDFVYQYRGSELKLATLSYSKIVIDEIQMYSPDLVAYLISGLKDIVNLGGKFAIITATFPSFIAELLKEQGIEFTKPKPFLFNKRIRHNIEIKNDQINSEFICSKYNDNKILVIVNTVKKAQQLYKELKKNNNLNCEINLFHSGFIKKDRQKKEQSILSAGTKDNKNPVIWICTQVAEASLDIDFDILITELSDINGLFQRMGRCYRKREYNGKVANCIIFDGGKEETSRIGSVIDRDIFEYSKEELRTIGNGPISESKKIDIVNNIYNMDRLSETEYMKKILKSMEYLNTLKMGEFTKSEAKEKFRNINSITVVPKTVYNENKSEIDLAIAVLGTKKSSYSDKDQKELKLKKLEARNIINGYSISIPYYRVSYDRIENIKINDYESMIIYNCKYSYEQGIEYSEPDSEKDS